MQAVLEEAQQLSPVEQLELISALFVSLQAQSQQVVSQDAIPDSSKRAKPIVNLDEYVADFWPDDESIDELIAYIRQERVASRR